MSSIREMRRTTQTGEAKLDTLPSFTGGTVSIRKLREQKLPTQPTVRQTAPKTEQQSQPQGWVRRVEEKYQQITQKRTPQQRLPDVPKPKENPTPGAQGEDWTKVGQRFLENSQMKNGATPHERKSNDLRPYSFYTEKIDTAIADGDWTSAGKWTDALCNANLSVEDADEVVRYIDKTFSRENLYNNGGKANKGLSAARYILDLADRSQWETLYDFMNSPESEDDKELIMEVYGIDADSEESKRDNYYGLVEQLLKKTDQYGYDTLGESAESYKTQIATNRFLRRAKENFIRASQSPAHATQMDSFIRSQTAYYILNVLSGRLGVEDNGVNTEDILQTDTTKYLISYLKTECGVDLKGINAENYRKMIRNAMNEHSEKARIMGGILQSEGYDTEAVREYAKLGVQQGYENTRSKTFEEWKAVASWYDWAGMNALTVPFKAAIQPFVSVATLSALGGKNSDVNDPKSYIPLYGSQDGIDMIRSATVEEIEKSINWRLFGRNVASFLYTTGMSALDSAASAYSFGKLSVFLMGTTAAGSQANNILARGGNRRQALYGGLAAGAVEMATEYFSLDKLLKNADTVTNLKAWFKAVGQQFFTEGSEGMASEILDILVDAANMGNLSENSQAIKEYMKQGLSYDEARTRVLYDNIASVIEEGIVDGLSSLLKDTPTLISSLRSLNSSTKSGTYDAMKEPQSSAYVKNAVEPSQFESNRLKSAEVNPTTVATNRNASKDLSATVHSGRGKPTAHSLLMEMDTTEVENTIERKALKNYQQIANRQLMEQQKLGELQAELDAIPVDRQKTFRARFLRDEIIKTKNRIKTCQSILTRLKTDIPLTYLIAREIKPRLAETE